MPLYFNLAHRKNPQSPCDIDVCFEPVPCPIYITAGIGQGAGGCPLSAAEALDPQWREYFEKSQGTWLIPYLENLAKGVPLPREQMIWFYTRYNRQPPKSTEIPLPPNEMDRPTAKLTSLHIRPDDLTGPAIIALLHEHLRCMAEISPPESRHALNLDGLRQPEVTLWTIWSGPELAGCGALKQLDPTHGEVKSMRTAYAFQRQGVASRMMQHLIEESQRRGYRRLSLETGAQSYFDPARKLYASYGFTLCGPFGSYRLDPNSVFMTKEL